jgi:outer membrane receptor protein involved in Fe transport
LLHIPDLGASVSQATKTDRWSQEVRLDAHAFDNSLLYEVGGYFTQEDDTNRVPGIDPFSTVTLAPIPLPFYFINAEIGTRYREFSGFANATYSFTPEFSVQGGVRYSEDHQIYNQDYSGLLVGPVPLTVTGGREQGDKTTYLGTASYKLTKDDLLYLRVATGYRPGGPNAIPPPVVYPAPQTFSPDSLISYEVGYKAVLADGKASFETALFKTDWKDIQIQTSQGGFNFFVNGGSATSKGAEATLLVNPMSGLSVRATASYVDAYLTSAAPLAEGISGDELPFVPKVTASLAPSYHWQIGSGWGATIGSSVDFTGTRRSDYSGRAPVEVPSYTTVNLNASLDRDHWRFTLYGKNVGDSDGITSLAARTLVAGVTPLAAAIIQPRTIGIEANYHY